jgi:hypothetical protein
LPTPTDLNSPEKYTSLKQDIAHLAAQTLLDWGLPDELCTAARRMAQLQPGTAFASENASPEHPVEQLAIQALEWQTRQDALVFASGSLGDTQRFTLELRRLLRQVYLDYPFPRLVLLLIAHHHARMKLQPNEALIALTRWVYNPLVEMLGIWELSRDWLDQIADQEPAAEGLDMDRLKDSQLNNQADISLLLENSAADIPAADQMLRLRMRKARAFEQIQRAILQKYFQVRPDSSSTPPQVKLSSLTKASLIRRFRSGKWVAGLQDRLQVVIQCSSSDDCYLVLGIVHALGRPLSGQVDDYLAYPKPNGFSALNTTLMLTLEPRQNEPHLGGRVVVEVRILTAAMEKCNEMGLVSQLNPLPERIPGLAWWGTTAQENSIRHINRYFKPSEKRYQSVAEYLSQYDLDSDSHPLYIFTPQGEIFFVEGSFTALDFAYAIHSDLGNQAVQIEVNGSAVEYGQRLRNGDIVRIEIDLHSPGPDFTWLARVNSQKARSRIRRFLTNLPGETHPGRRLIQAELDKVLEYYLREKGFNLSITTRQLEHFLNKEVEARGLADLKHLYAQVKNGQQASHLVRRLVNERLLHLVTDLKNKPLNYPRHMVSFCSTCLPVPGQAITGLREREGHPRRLVIHAEESKLCWKDVKTDPLLKRVEPLQWLKLKDHNPLLFEVNILGRDRSGLLRDLLQPVYQTESCTLLEVHAQNARESSYMSQAQVQIVLELPAPHIQNELRRRLEAVKDVLQVRIVSLSATQSVGDWQAFTPVAINPYVMGDRLTPVDFFDRERESEWILSWLNDKNAPGWRLLNGSPRSGKSSLARFIKNYRLRGSELAFPVYLDCQAFLGSRAEEVLQFILSEVLSDLQLTEPPFPYDPVSPAAWLQRCLANIASRIGLPLLLMLDEFTVFVAGRSRGRLAEDLFPILTSLFSDTPATRWLILVNIDVYRDFSNPPDVLQFFAKAPDSLLLQPFPQSIARTLVRQPAERLGYRFPNVPASRSRRKRKGHPNDESPIVERILSLAGGHPYYIKRICNAMFAEAWDQGRTNFTPPDLDHALENILHNPMYFEPFWGRLSQEQRLILAAVAQASQSKTWADYPDFREILSRSELDLQDNDLLELLAGLETLERLELRGEGERLKARIPIRLCSLWAQDPLNWQEILDFNL